MTLKFLLLGVFSLHNTKFPGSCEVQDWEEEEEGETLHLLKFRFWEIHIYL